MITVSLLVSAWHIINLNAKINNLENKLKDRISNVEEKFRITLSLGDGLYQDLGYTSAKEIYKDLRGVEHKLDEAMKKSNLVWVDEKTEGHWGTF